MRHPEDQSTPSNRPPAGPPLAPTPPNVFSPEYLDDLRGRDDSWNAAEAEFAGPWKVEPLPGHPGAVAVLREYESLAAGDEPEAVFLDEETAQICAAVLPGVERDQPFHLREDRAADGLIAAGFPMATPYGEQGLQVRGWFRRYRPAVVRAMAAVELLNRSPAAHAAVLEAGGSGALERVGRALAARRG